MVTNTYRGAMLFFSFAKRETPNKNLKLSGSALVRNATAENHTQMFDCDLDRSDELTAKACAAMHNGKGNALFLLKVLDMINLKSNIMAFV
jgi:hypothetical protein